jgi:hypothetical protein
VTYARCCTSIYPHNKSATFGVPACKKRTKHNRTICSFAQIELKMWTVSCTICTASNCTKLAVFRRHSVQRNSHNRSRKVRITGNAICALQDRASPSGYSTKWRLDRHCEELNGSPTVRVVVDRAYCVTDGRTNRRKDRPTLK